MREGQSNYWVSGSSNMSSQRENRNYSNSSYQNNYQGQNFGNESNQQRYDSSRNMNSVGNQERGGRGQNIGSGNMGPQNVQHGNNMQYGNNMRRQGGMDSIQTPMFNNAGQGMGGNAGNMMAALGNVQQFPGGQSQIELASQILNAVLSTATAAQFQDNRVRERSPPFRRDRSMDFRDRKPSFNSRKSPPRRSRSPRRGGDSFNRFSSDRRRGRSFEVQRPRFERPQLGHRHFESRRRSIDKSRSEFGRKRSRTGSETREERGHRSKDRESEDKVSVDAKRSKKSDESEDGDQSIKKEISALDSEDKETSKTQIPAEALFCHVCNHGGFTSEQTYLFHLEGIRHRKTANAFHDKNETTLEYLRKNARLASIRVGRLDNSVAPYQCSTCHAHVRESFFSHKKLLEHRLVKKFLKPRCCGRIFKNHHNMDEHRLSLPHLKKVRNANEQKKIFMKQVDEDQDKKPDEIFIQLKNKMTNEFEELENLDFIQPFDGNTMIGMEFLQPKPSLLCEPCQMFLPKSVKAVECHLVSLYHYNSIIDFMRNKRRIEKKLAHGEDIKKEASDEDEKKDDVDSVKEESSDEDDLMFDDQDHIILEEAGEEDDMSEAGDNVAEELDGLKVDELQQEQSPNMDGEENNTKESVTESIGEDLDADVLNERECMSPIDL